MICQTKVCANCNISTFCWWRYRWRSGGIGGAAPQAPAFNIVGSSGVNQLSDAIAGQGDRPVRTYVVASDVSTAQELDRNIIESASL